MNCAQCERPAADGAAFCGGCGARLAGAAKPERSIFDRVSRQVGAWTGTGDLEGFRAGDLFSSVTEKHTEEDVEESFIVGARSTTPDLASIRAVWPKPWVFVSVFLLLLGTTLALAVCTKQFENPKAIPGLMIVGSFAVPLLILMVYFELNVPRNVSMYQVLRMLAVGGALSLVVTLFLGPIEDQGAIGIGIGEEFGKVAALIIVVRNPRYPWILNGLLFGGAIGAGFAGFESAGYAFQALSAGDDGQLNVDAMIGSITLRGLLAPGGHVAWAAMTGAGLWAVRGSRQFGISMLREWAFVRVFIFAVVLHALWDFEFGIPFLLKDGALALLALIGVLGFVQSGIKQVQTAQLAARVAAEIAA